MVAPTRARKSERTQARLVRATRDEIAEQGSFTADRVTTRIGLSPATFYAYFPSKGDALAAAFGSVLDELVAFVDGELCVERLLDEGLEARCRAWAGAMAGFFSAHSLVFRAAQGAMSESPALRETYRAHEAEAFERYHRFLDLGQRAGKIRAGDLESLARGLMVLTQGLHNPLLLGRPAGDPVFDDLARALRGLLEPA